MTRIPSNHPCLPESVRSQMGKPKRHKYGAKATVVDGRRFSSLREAKRYGELKAMARIGDIGHLELQPKYDLHVLGGIKVGTYSADFRYRDCHGKIIVEDVKSAGTRTTVYRLKKRMVEAEYGIVIKEV